MAALALLVPNQPNIVFQLRILCINGHFPRVCDIMDAYSNYLERRLRSGIRVTFVAIRLRICQAAKHVEQAANQVGQFFRESTRAIRNVFNIQQLFTNIFSFFRFSHITNAQAAGLHEPPFPFELPENSDDHRLLLLTNIESAAIQ